MLVGRLFFPLDLLCFAVSSNSYMIYEGGIMQGNRQKIINRELFFTVGAGKKNVEKWKFGPLNRRITMMTSCLGNTWFIYSRRQTARNMWFKGSILILGLGMCGSIKLFPCIIMVIKSAKNPTSEKALVILFAFVIRFEFSLHL